MPPPHERLTEQNCYGRDGICKYYAKVHVRRKDGGRMPLLSCSGKAIAKMGGGEADGRARHG